MVSNLSGGWSPIFGGVSNFSGGVVSNFFSGVVSNFFLGGSPEYGQRSAGTHPTGMHSCLSRNLVLYFGKILMLLSC